MNTLLRNALRKTSLLAAGACLIPGAGLGTLASGLPITGPPPPAGLPACRTAERPAPMSGYADWASTILDPTHALPRGYEPPDLVTVRIGGQPVRLRAFVAQPLRAMLDAARRDGVIISINSAYRSFAEQQRLAHDHAGQEDLVARPGHSEHQLGTAVDLAGGHAWLAENAWRHGFVVSYPPGRSAWSCYRAEPWHLRYFGVERAAAMRSSGLSPREWLWQQAKGPGSARAFAL